MTTFNLTNLQDNFTGGNGTDIFQGVGGGADQLLGNGGNDFFNIQEGQTGVINGGTGFDTLHMTGPGFNNEFTAGLSITGVESLIMDATNIFATVAQLKGFSHFGINNDSDQFHFFLQGSGGLLNFSNSWKDPQELHVEAQNATSAVNIVGSTKGDVIFGSDFNDTLNGNSGADEVRGGDANDVVNGGLGNDILYGDDGKDSFLFNTALGSNVDHFGDFRPVDDSIKLDDAIFSWAGQTLGALQATNFKVIGTGQTVDADDHIIYNQISGVVQYDVDGAGGVAAKTFAIADNFSGDVPILTVQDFFIV